MRSGANKFIISLLLICATPNSIIAQASTYLDGKSYAIVLTMLSGGGGSSSTWVKDSFIFKSGKMYSLELKKEKDLRLLHMLHQTMVQIKIQS